MLNKMISSFAAMGFLALGFGSAHAAEYQIGAVYPIKTIGCDETSQLQKILYATRDQGQEAGMAVLKGYVRQKNADNQPVCGFIEGRFKLAKFVETVTLKPGDTHIVMIETSNGTQLAAMWSGNIAAATHSSLPPNGRDGNLRYIITEPSLTTRLWNFL